MRYSIVTETYPPEVNGVALTVQGLEQGLRDRGHDVELVRPRQDGDADLAPPALPKHVLLVRGAALPRYPGLKFGLPATRTLRKRWQLVRPDAIYVATEGPLGWSALRAARQLGIPAATGFHTRFDDYMRDYGAPWLQGAALRWMRRFHNGAQATLVPTLQLPQFLQGEGYDNVVRLARAVDTRQFDPARRDRGLRAQWGIDDDGVVAIYLGRIAAEKNLPLAVRAVRALQAIRPDAKFVWGGDGPARHFASGDLFVFPSHSETFGNVTLEALASGVPTVAFDYGAAHEYLRDGVHGAAIACTDAPSRDDAGFIAAVARIGSDDELRGAMRTACRDAVAALRPEQVAEDFDRILRSLAHHGGAHVAAAATP